MRRLLITLAVLLGLCVGYLAGCRSHAPAHAVTGTPEPGQRWVDMVGKERVVRCVQAGVVWWHRPGGSEIDRPCSIRAWRAWVRDRKGRIEP